MWPQSTTRVLPNLIPDLRAGYIYEDFAEHISSLSSRRPAKTERFHIGKLFKLVSEIKRRNPVDGIESHPG